ncbi:unnamed protein product, partial [Polarella glacialis]
MLPNAVTEGLGQRQGAILIAEAALDGTGTAAVTSAIWIVPTVSLTQSFPHTSSGMISLLAGAAGVPGFGGDGGPASLALLSGPVALALDSIGRLLVADKFNNRIRRIDLDHRVSADSTVTPATYVDVPQIETIAGTGAYGYAGDGGSALTAQFRNPTGIAINPVTDDIYIVDEKNNRIRLISNKTGKVSAFAGLGVSGDTGDGGLATLARVSLGWAQVAVDLFGTVYLADRGNNRLRVINPRSGIINGFAGTGTTTPWRAGGFAALATSKPLRDAVTISLPGQLALPPLPEASSDATTPGSQLNALDVYLADEGGHQ